MVGAGTGAVVGAGTGAVVGFAVGDAVGVAEGGAVGAGTGAVVGSGVDVVPNKRTYTSLLEDAVNCEGLQFFLFEHVEVEGL
mmetsp:Transcript_14513/g.30024  ORF Transcript_14513/g.30024 Transcript_14513/m.30024 type:complete len:82 (+) Transcript_14513:2-247(+)